MIISLLSQGYLSLKQFITKFSFLWLLLFFTWLPLQSLLAEDSEFQNPNISKEINTLITAKRHPYLKHSDFSYRAEDLDALYKNANYQLLWLGNTRSAKNTADALDLLANAPSHGLSRENYDVDQLRGKYSLALQLPPTAYKDLTLYDTALSIAVLRFLHDMHYGRVNPQGINFHLQLREKKLLDLPTLIKDSLLQFRLSQ